MQATKLVDSTISLNNIKVLYCEDDQQSQFRMSSYLSRRFDNVFIASDGEEGLKIFLKHRPQLIISDIRMPKMDGIAMCRAIREHDPHVDIILISAHNEPDLLHASIDLNIEKYIVKPVDLNILIDSIITIATRTAKQKSNTKKQDIDDQYDQEKVQTYINKMLNIHHDDDASSIRQLTIPKSTISGDFYCISQYKDTRYIMLADGTGRYGGMQREHMEKIKDYQVEHS